MMRARLLQSVWYDEDANAGAKTNFASLSIQRGEGRLGKEVWL